MRIPASINTLQNLFQSDSARNSSKSNGLDATTLARLGAGGTSNADTAATSSSSSFDANTTAKNILGAVQAQLLQAQANGATPEELAGMLQQARDGAQSGFDSAISQLKNTGDLTDSLSSGISAALQQVDKGFSDLAQSLGIGDDSQAAGTTQQGSSLGDLASSYGDSFAANQSVDMTVKTADGDTIKLQIGTDGGKGGVTVSVDGNLNAGETKALNDLVDKVGKLSDSFFSGDMDSATRQANALQLDNPELGSLSLTLRSGGAPTSSGAAAYQGVQSLGSSSLADYAASSVAQAQDTSGASEVKSQLAQQLSALIPDASISDNPAATLKQLLAAQVAAKGQQDSPLLGFADRFLDAMGANRTASTTATAQAA